MTLLLSAIVHKTSTINRTDHEIVCNTTTDGRDATCQNVSNSDESREIDISKQLDLELVDETVDYGMGSMRELYDETEPRLYKLGLVLKGDDPAGRVASFSAPSERALELAKFGYASLEATRKFFERYPENATERQTQSQPSLRQSTFADHCPQFLRRRCSPASQRYRTADGSCNNLAETWKGASLMPMQRFLRAHYADGVQSVRRSVFGNQLPSAREISAAVHEDRDVEMRSVTLMFMQWGQFLDHDVVATAQSRGFNGSIPQCCERGGLGFLPSELLHPSCLPIEIPSNDRFYSKFGIRCMEFIRSAPTARINCDLGWREQINQATSFVDASPIYGTDSGSAETVRTFRNGQLVYGRDRNSGPLLPPDPPGGELCRTGVITTDCFAGGDGRAIEQPGLTAFHIVWIRFHNILAEGVARINPHWSDEKVFLEVRKIVGALVQHITYREFLPVTVGPEVMELFQLKKLRKGYYDGYDGRVNPAVANSFGAAAFRFGHSLVQNSYVRTDEHHREISNNVSLHQEQDNVQNIWSGGSLDRLLLGFSNQPSQRRDEFIAEELTNHLFQSRGGHFGMDLAAINIQRGRDHGLPPYTAFREPCGLAPINNWRDLKKVMNFEAVQRLRSVYLHVGDVDLYTGGLAEWPVRGGVVGPTFACIIAQQFMDLRKGDRFWYENGNFRSAFTPAQLQQIRKVTFAQVLCHATDEIKTIQPFVFLSADNKQNARLPCTDPFLDNFDLTPWIETTFDNNNRRMDRRVSTKKKTTKKTTTRRPTKVRTTTRTPTTTKRSNANNYQQVPLTVYDVPDRPHYQHYYRPTDMTYLVGYVTERTTPVPPLPFHVDIKISYALPQTMTKPPRDTNYRPTTYYQYDRHSTTTAPPRRRRTKTPTYNNRQTTEKPCDDRHRPQPQNPYVIDDQFTYHFVTNVNYQTTKRPKQRPTTKYPSYLYYDPNMDLTQLPTFEQSYKKFDNDGEDKKYVKISSAKGHVERLEDDVGMFREGGLELEEFDERGANEASVVAVDVIPSEVSEEHWMFFNAKEEDVVLKLQPELNLNVSYSKELPHPMTKTMT